MPDHGTMIAELLSVADDRVPAHDRGFLGALQEFYPGGEGIGERDADYLERLYVKVCGGPR